MIPLGNFDLHAPIGRGGMAEVWAGVHRQARIPVAVKVMTNHQVLEGKAFATFRNEVRAMAGLWHPHIVRVLDMGEVSDDVQRMSEGRIRARAPYVVMELVEGGSLRVLCGRLAWTQLRRVLLSLLDALAHAHARGVIHRDLKPGNVLLGGMWHQVKLTDFGLAHVVHGAAVSDDDVIGTPAYMAPEQFRGQWRDFGPWTDLYSLGCLVYSLTTGAPPFGRVKGNAARTAHLVRPVPPMIPKQPVPVAFHAWVHQLLEKDPARRFVSAADAAWALMGIPDERFDGDDVPEDDALEDDDTAESMSTLTFVRSPGLDDGPAPEPFPSLELEPRLRVSSNVPPVPETWRRGLDDEVETPLKRAMGIGVYRLRRIPLVDREAERDALWDALRRVHAGSFGLLVIEGPGGTGTTRLAEWLCERAAEVGAAVPMTASHGSIPNPSHGLRPMVLRAFGAQGLSPGAALMERVKARAISIGFHEPADHLALYALAADDGPVQLRLQSERSGVLQRLVGRLAIERPVVLWFDDVQWGLDSLSFVRDLVKNMQRRPQALLVVLTARSDELADNLEVSLLLETLVRDARGARMHVGPLEGRYRQMLVANLLGLRWDLAEQVDERTEGNPLFAIQLVGDWVDRGLLVASPQGYSLEPGSHVELPDDLYSMWSARLERFLQNRKEDDGKALELAAVLGQSVEPIEWRAVLQAQDVRPSAWLVEDLVEARLGQCGPEGPEHGWSFVHGMFRECLERRAESGGRAAPYHRACAKYLKGLEGPDIAQRIARHSAAAGDVAEAADAYLRALHEKQASGLLLESKSLKAELWQVLGNSSLPRSDVRWGAARVFMGNVALGLGDWATATTEAKAALSESRQYGWAGVRAQALNLLGNIAMRQGRTGDSEVFHTEALAAARAIGEPAILAQNLLSMGELLLRLGRYQEAQQHQLQSIELLRAQGDRRGQGNALLAVAEMARQQGDLEGAARSIHDALDMFTAEGSQSGLAGALNNLGDIARLQGRLAEAQGHYASARRVLESMDMVDAVYPRLNLAIVAVEMQRFGEARTLVDGILADKGPVRFEVRPMANLILATCDAYERHWGSFDTHADAAETGIQELGFLDLDFGRMAHRAADLARAAGEGVRADRMTAIEARQIEGLAQQAAAIRHVDASAP